MHKESIWVTGASGHLGKLIVKKLSKNHEYKVVGTSDDVDVTDLAAVESAAAVYRPTIIINCASMSDAQRCEEERVQAFRVNALGARNMASVARKYNAKIIHFSTDDVFCGVHNRPKNEFDLPTPETVYGQSKLAGENFVRELCPKHLIIRSSWVYGSNAKDYFALVAQYGAKHETFSANVDCFSSPTYAGRIADFLLKVIETDEYGIMHVSSEGMCSRYEYAREILSLLGYDPNLVQQSFKAVAKSAVTSTVLENLMLKMTGVYEMPEWSQDLKAYAAKYKEKNL